MIKRDIIGCISGILAIALIAITLISDSRVTAGLTLLFGALALGLLGDRFRFTPPIEPPAPPLEGKTKARMIDGITFDIEIHPLIFANALEEARDWNRSIKIVNKDGLVRYLNPHAVIYFEEQHDET